MFVVAGYRPDDQTAFLEGTEDGNKGIEFAASVDQVHASQVGWKAYQVDEVREGNRVKGV